MGCGSVSVPLQGLGTADLNGLSEVQIQAMLASPKIPTSVKEQLVCKYTPADSELEKMDCDFDKEGSRLLRAARASPAGGACNDVDPLWTHPTSGAKLYVGNESTAMSAQELAKHQITRIVRCLDYEGIPGSFESALEYRYLHFPIGWWREAPGCKSQRGAARILAPLLGFVEEALAEGSSVLIHCLAGAHRAGTAGIACLMHLCRLDRNSATCAAKAARPTIDCIAHLGALLRRFEVSLREGLVTPAIKDASESGFQNAVNTTFKLAPLKMSASTPPQGKPLT
eukprot:TRINITY_DN91802_c0_g1_i1.p1 TRINITY_DN91802_c0_g1~~TRINITY_DN91802_c0_g1_i1.p1  ORF type:complete len:294 (-),score=49.98 TRINITY_DN91802_c0_g1_i1:9-860(-)